MKEMRTEGNKSEPTNNTMKFNSYKLYLDVVNEK